MDRRPTCLASQVVPLPESVNETLGLLYDLGVLTNIRVCDLAKTKRSINTTQWIITGLERNIVSNLSKYYDLLELNS